MESSRRDLFIDMIVDRFNFKSNQITLSPCSTFTPETGLGLPKTRVSFYCVSVLILGVKLTQVLELKILQRFVSGY